MTNGSETTKNNIYADFLKSDVDLHKVNLAYRRGMHQATVADEKERMLTESSLNESEFFEGGSKKNGGGSKRNKDSKSVKAEQDRAAD